MLIEKAQRGDRGALNELIRKHQERAYQYAFRLTRNPDVAADVVADGFVRINNALKNFKGNAAFTTWLYRIITNCYLDQRKREKGKSNVSLDSSYQQDDEDVTREIEDTGRTPDELVERNQREELLHKALALLPEFQKSMIVMYHAEQLSYEEIAEALDLPIGTVKSRLNRARISLREILAQDEELFKV
ncbi:MAG: RNA polymerase subunit sigma-24 [Armatimonadetes bacterium Cent15-Ar3]|nr:MAG: RNA polymerase subunit sigma-24 [Armatimonadetes bacterium Cent15-Ar3]